ncbi:hypothetical protein [Halovulum marinum]|uniref:hypothetical protein n=1 Tax=Halovulum marinum TaxID=2662447 RepID=UPI001F2C0BD7|nr:hypothetical protein [Halovulum marinum]
MSALVGRIVKATFSSVVRYFGTIPHPQADQPERQQAAQLGAALCGRHLVGRERIGAFHAGLGTVVSSGLYSSMSEGVPADPAQVEESIKRT